MKTEFVQNLDDGKVIGVACQFCGHETKHLILKSIERRWGNNDIQGNDSYQIIQCRGCENVSYRTESSNSDDYNYVGDGDMEPSISVTVYPHRVSGRTQLENLWRIPHAVSKIYKETFESICTCSYILTGLGLRAIVEAVCVAEGATQWNFHKKIDHLVSINKLTRVGGDLLLPIRDIGNGSAHKSIPMKSDDIDIALEIVEGLLKNVYIIPAEAEKFNKNK